MNEFPTNDAQRKTQRSPSKAVEVMAHYFKYRTEKDYRKNPALHAQLNAITKHLASNARPEITHLFLTLSDTTYLLAQEKIKILLFYLIAEAEEKEKRNNSRKENQLQKQKSKLYNRDTTLDELYDTLLQLLKTFTHPPKKNLLKNLEINPVEPVNLAAIDSLTKEEEASCLKELRKIARNAETNNTYHTVIIDYLEEVQRHTNVFELAQQRVRRNTRWSPEIKTEINSKLIKRYLEMLCWIASNETILDAHSRCVLFMDFIERKRSDVEESLSSLRDLLGSRTYTYPIRDVDKWNELLSSQKSKGVKKSLEASDEEREFEKQLYFFRQIIPKKPSKHEGKQVNDSALRQVLPEEKLRQTLHDAYKNYLNSVLKLARKTYIKTVTLPLLARIIETHKWLARNEQDLAHKKDYLQQYEELLGTCISTDDEEILAFHEKQLCDLDEKQKKIIRNKTIIRQSTPEALLELKHEQLVTKHGRLNELTEAIKKHRTHPTTQTEQYQQGYDQYCSDYASLTNKEDKHSLKLTLLLWQERLLSEQDKLLEKAKEESECIVKVGKLHQTIETQHQTIIATMEALKEIKQNPTSQFEKYQERYGWYLKSYQNTIIGRNQSFPLDSLEGSQNQLSQVQAQLVKELKQEHQKTEQSIAWHKDKIRETASCISRLRTVILEEATNIYNTQIKLTRLVKANPSYSNPEALEEYHSAKTHWEDQNLPNANADETATTIEALEADLGKLTTVRRQLQEACDNQKAINENLKDLVSVYQTRNANRVTGYINQANCQKQMIYGKHQLLIKRGKTLTSFLNTYCNEPTTKSRYANYLRAYAAPPREPLSSDRNPSQALEQEAIAKIYTDHYQRIEGQQDILLSHDLTKEAINDDNFQNNITRDIQFIDSLSGNLPDDATQFKQQLINAIIQNPTFAREVKNFYHAVVQENYSLNLNNFMGHTLLECYSEKFDPKNNIYRLIIKSGNKEKYFLYHYDKKKRTNVFFTYVTQSPRKTTTLHEKIYVRTLRELAQEDSLQNKEEREQQLFALYLHRYYEVYGKKSGHFENDGFLNTLKTQLDDKVDLAHYHFDPTAEPAQITPLNTKQITYCHKLRFFFTPNISPNTVKTYQHTINWIINNDGENINIQQQRLKGLQRFRKQELIANGREKVKEEIEEDLIYKTLREYIEARQSNHPEVAP